MRSRSARRAQQTRLMTIRPNNLLGHWRTSQNSVARYATTELHGLVETEDRTSAAVANAGFDLIGWRQPEPGKPTVVAFAYRVVEDVASLDAGLADEIRAGLAAVQSYLRTNLRSRVQE